MIKDAAIPPFVAGGQWLLTSASAKVDLTSRMRRALNAVGLRLYAADASPFSAAFGFADDSFLLPPLDEPGFMQAFIAACQERDVRVVLPSRDADVLYFARHERELLSSGIWPVVSPYETVATCCDKIRFYDHCQAAGLPVLPRITDLSACEYPCFARPRSGAGGAGARTVCCAEEMETVIQSPGLADVLIQPLCSLPEFSIDALFAPGGQLMQWVVRERIRVRAGESVVSRTVSLPALDSMMRKLAGALSFSGPVTVQVFHSDQEGPYLIEVNPRFGGASALGIEAGLQTPERLAALARGDMETFEQDRPLQIGLTMLRYNNDVFISPDEDSKQL